MSTLDHYSRNGLRLLPGWAVLLFLGTLSHQPPYQTEFAAWSRYVTTTPFLVSHLVASILGGGIGLIGFAALSVVLVLRGSPRLGACGLVTTALSGVLLACVFGVAAFAQPALGRSYLAGHPEAHPVYDDVNGPPLLCTALAAVLLLTVGVSCLAIGARRVGLIGRWSTWALLVGAPTFAIVGVILADVVQSVGAALLVAGTVAVARGGQEVAAATGSPVHRWAS